MSRCFPFPPLGYEREHRPEDLDAWKEENHKEKKQKKEKKDKERREGKGKRGKERSDKKHGEKKDQKEKHKDKKEKHRVKKKEKNREKDKEKNSISDESNVAEKLEESSEDMLHSKGHSKVKSSFTDEAKHATLFLDQNGGKLIQSSLLLQGTEMSKFVQELDRRIRDDEKGAESQLISRISGLGKIDQKEAARAGTKGSSEVLADDKGKNKDQRVNSRKIDMQRFREEFSAKTMVQNNAGTAKSKIEAMPRPMEEHKDSNASTCLLMDISRNTVDEGNIRRIKDRPKSGQINCRGSLLTS
ncbi:glutamic acid-rich protein-like isoform X2 [Olea europaea var. sylvestris]|uniref:glutamic acid-rich protein-like isoform X2 n=1 Tax=Olea europaea var. sylvestris TaxID=158386 RepID=UPI000C1CEDC5|nr:glutamic acid-rich protein-like isoform X2 [Olea europaea var. sylvestris]